MSEAKDADNGPGASDEGPVPGVGASGDDGGEDITASVRRFVTIFLFILALFVIFDTELRNAAGDAVGAVLAPLFAFDHQFPVFTFFPVAIIMVLVTSVIRHFLMDWKEMAKVQHITSHLNKELFKATKNDNHYKVKKLNEIKKSEEFTKLQSKQMGSTWKVMGPTMLIAVAIFAWMFSFAAAPVAFGVQAPEGSAALVWDSNVLATGVVDGDNTIPIGQGADVYVFAPDGGQTVAMVRGWDGARFQGPAHALNLSQGVPVNVSAGTYEVETLPGESSLTAGGTKLLFPVVAVEGSGPLLFEKVYPRSGSNVQTITVEEGDRVVLLLPARAPGDGNGAVHVRFTPTGTGGGTTTSTTVELGSGDVWQLPTITTHVIAKEGHVPWATFDLNGTTLLPNWILLYSLFTIPFGYLFQKLFKAWEYRDQLDELEAAREG